MVLYSLYSHTFATNLSSFTNQYFSVYDTNILDGGILLRCIGRDSLLQCKSGRIA